MYRGRNFSSIMKRRGGGSFFCNLHQINWIHIDFQCSLLTFNWLNDLTKNVYKQIRVSMRTKTFAKKCEHFCSYFEFFRETDLSKILQKSETFRIFRELTKCEKMWNYRRNCFYSESFSFCTSPHFFFSLSFYPFTLALITFHPSPFYLSIQNKIGVLTWIF